MISGIAILGIALVVSIFTIGVPTGVWFGARHFFSESQASQKVDALSTQLSPNLTHPSPPLPTQAILVEQIPEPTSTVAAACVGVNVSQRRRGSRSAQQAIQQQAENVRKTAEIHQASVGVMKSLLDRLEHREADIAAHKEAIRSLDYVISKLSSTENESRIIDVLFEIIASKAACKNHQDAEKAKADDAWQKVRGLQQILQTELGAKSTGNLGDDEIRLIENKIQSDRSNTSIVKTSLNQLAYQRMADQSSASSCDGDKTAIIVELVKGERGYLYWMVKLRQDHQHFISNEDQTQSRKNVEASINQKQEFAFAKLKEILAHLNAINVCMGRLKSVKWNSNIKRVEREYLEAWHNLQTAQKAAETEGGDQSVPLSLHTKEQELHQALIWHRRRATRSMYDEIETAKTEARKTDVALKSSQIKTVLEMTPSEQVTA